MKKSGLKITKVTSKHGSLYDYFFKGKSQSSKFHHWCSDKFKIQPIRKHLREKYGKNRKWKKNITKQEQNASVAQSQTLFRPMRFPVQLQLFRR